MLKRLVIVGFILLQVFPAALAQGGTITVLAPKDVLDDYQLLLANRDPLEIQNYAGTGSRRDTVELILFQQAMYRGGSGARITFRAVDSYPRILEEIVQGRAQASGTSVWDSDAKESGALLSAPLIQDGEYMVGLYTIAGNIRVLQASPEALRSLTAVSNRAWPKDMAVLAELHIRRVESAPTFTRIAAMVAAGRGDFLMRSFKATPDMSDTVDGVRFVPIPGYKVSFPGSRHFLLAPDAAGRNLQEILDRGLASLAREGRIRQAYTDAGFFQARVKDWKVLNPRPSPRS